MERIKMSKNVVGNYKEKAVIVPLSPCVPYIYYLFNPTYPHR